MSYPQYVQKDLKVLYNAELKVDKYGNLWTDYHKLSVKLWTIASKYPQKHLEAILDYLGYFVDGADISEKDYRAEIMHNAEYYFIEAMKHSCMCYGDKVNKQSDFIEIGFIDTWYNSNRSFRESGYEIKYPTKVKQA